MRPKTAVSSSEATAYGPDDEFSPHNDIFYTSEIVTDDSKANKFVNEFELLKTIGEGAYSKVKLVKWSFTEGEEVKDAFYGMKILHKPTLKWDRCPIYLPNGEIEWSNSLEKVYSEIDIWSQLNNKYIVRLYELIENEDHDYIYLVMEHCDLGQLANWDFQ